MFQQLHGNAKLCMCMHYAKHGVSGLVNSNFWLYTKQQLWQPLLYFMQNALKGQYLESFVLGATSGSPHQRIEYYIFW